MQSITKLLKTFKPQGIILVVCCFCYWFSSCENDMSKLPGNNPLSEVESDKADDVTFIYSEQGVTKAKIFTKKFIGNDKAKPPYIDFMNGVKMELFDKDLKVESTITARTARYYTQDENVIARDSVIIVNAKGDKLQTEELIWNRKMERFYTDKFVKITKDSRVTYGKGLEASQDFNYIRIIEQRGSIPVDDNDIPKME